MVDAAVIRMHSSIVTLGNGFAVECSVWMVNFVSVGSTWTYWSTDTSQVHCAGNTKNSQNCSLPRSVRLVLNDQNMDCRSDSAQTVRSNNWLECVAWAHFEWFVERPMQNVWTTTILLDWRLDLMRPVSIPTKMSTMDWICRQSSVAIEWT